MSNVKLNCLCYIAILEIIQLWTNESVMLTSIISVEQQYLKPFGCMQKVNYWYSVEIIGTI